MRRAEAWQEADECSAEQAVAGWRTLEKLTAVLLQLRMLKPHVIGQRISAFQEQGSSAAAEASLLPQAQGKPKLAVISESGPSY